MNKLSFLASIKNENLRKKLLKSISDECLFQAIKEIAVNYKNNKIKLKTKKLKSPHKRNLNKFLKKINKSSKKRLIVQAGGWLPIVIPAVASLLSSLIN